MCSFFRDPFTAQMESLHNFKKNYEIIYIQMPILDEEEIQSLHSTLVDPDVVVLNVTIPFPNLKHLQWYTICVTHKE